MIKLLKIILVVLTILLAFVGIALGVYFLFPWNGEFFKNSSKEFAVPGLDTAFTPQGFSQIDDTHWLISGYMSDGSPSRFYVVDTNSGNSKYITLLDGTYDFTGHVGGVQVVGDTIWTVSGTDDGGYCYRFMLDDVMQAISGDKIVIEDKFATNNGADFVFHYDNMLWVGEFYRDGNYITDDTHHIKVRSGETNPAVVFGYNINENKQYGLENIKPVKALSIRGLCQGMDVTADGHFVMSTSYSIPDSNIYYYEDVLNNPSHSTISVNGDNIPLWFLDEEALISTTNAPSMAEELVVNGDKVYILFESACKKYRLVNRKKLSDVYSLPLEKLNKQ